MNTKKFLTVSMFLVMTVLIELGGFWQPAVAKSGTYPLVKGQTIGLGMQGLFVTNIPFGVTQVYLDNVGQIPARFNYKMDKQYRLPALEVRFQNSKGGEVARINALVYVYFEIAKAEHKLWSESGMQKLAIWFASLETDSWEICSTFYVNSTTGNNTYGRLSCLAPGSGYYVLAQGEMSKDQHNLQMIGGANSQSVTPLNEGANGKPYSTDGHTLLLLHLDGNYIGVQGEVGTATGTKFSAGHYGQGVVIDDTDTLTYKTADNLNREQGAIDFWLRPNWDGDDEQSYVFFEVGKDWFNRMRVMKDGANNLRFMLWDSATEYGVAHNVADWQAGEWHRVIVTWHDNNIALYIDGLQVESSSNAHVPDRLGDTISIGSMSAEGSFQANAIIDELRISDVPRTGGTESASTGQPMTLKVCAYIDGRSQLIIQGDKVHWHHMDFAAPGRWCADESTYLNQAIWKPTWPDVPGVENRNCNCDSSSYAGVPTMAKRNQTVGLDVVQSKGEVFIFQQPDATNNYTLIIEFDDNAIYGADWYEINLRYTVEVGG
jgi:hypothetical protein